MQDSLIIPPRRTFSDVPLVSPWTTLFVFGSTYANTKSPPLLSSLRPGLMLYNSEASTATARLGRLPTRHKATVNLGNSIMRNVSGRIEVEHAIMDTSWNALLYIQSSPFEKGYSHCTVSLPFQLAKSCGGLDARTD